jgi:hypothetical protein
MYGVASMVMLLWGLSFWKIGAKRPLPSLSGDCIRTLVRFNGFHVIPSILLPAGWSIIEL